MIRELDDDDVNYIVEGDTGQEYKSFEFRRSMIRFLNQIYAKADP